MRIPYPRLLGLAAGAGILILAALVAQNAYAVGDPSTESVYIF